VRTTLTLDPDIAVELERLQRARNTSFKAVVNEALREGLRQLDKPSRHRSFHTHSVDLGKPRIANIDDIAETLAVSDCDAFR